MRFIETPGTVCPIALPPANHSLEPWKNTRIFDGPCRLGAII